jgi:hypothetical protein
VLLISASWMSSFRAAIRRSANPGVTYWRIHIVAERPAHAARVSTNNAGSDASKTVSNYSASARRSVHKAKNIPIGTVQHTEYTLMAKQASL